MATNIAHIDPRLIESKINTLTADSVAAATALNARLSELTAEGQAAEWERISAPLIARLEAVKNETAQAAAALERVQEQAYLAAVPAEDKTNAGAVAGVGDELRYARLSKRVKGDRAWDTAAKILVEYAGTSFARLWATEMDSLGVFTPSMSAAMALEAHYPPYKNAVEFVKWGKTVINNSLSQGLRAAEKALAPGVYINRPAAPAPAVAVETIVTAPFAWAVTGTFYTHGEPMAAKDATDTAAAVEVREVLLGTLGKNTTVKVNGQEAAGDPYEIQESDTIQVRAAKIIASEMKAQQDKAARGAGAQ